MNLEEVLKKYKKSNKPMPLNKILRVFIREGIENFYICRKEDIDVLIEGIEHLQKENEELKDVDLTTVHIKGVCDEKDRWRTKIREKIEMLKPKLEEADKRTGKARTMEERVVLHCIGIRIDEKIKTLEDLLKEE